MSSESILTSVLVLELGFAMNENVLVTAPDETSALALAAPIAASAPIEAVTATSRRGLMIRFMVRSFPVDGTTLRTATLPSGGPENVSSRLLQFVPGPPAYLLKPAPERDSVIEH